MNGPRARAQQGQQMNPLEWAQQGWGPNRAQQMNGLNMARALRPNESPRAHCKPLHAASHHTGPWLCFHKHGAHLQSYKHIQTLIDTVDSII